MHSGLSVEQRYLRPISNVGLLRVQGQQGMEEQSLDRQGYGNAYSLVVLSSWASNSVTAMIYITATLGFKSSPQA